MALIYAPLNVMDIVTRLSIKTVLDIGCNQGNWAAQFNGTLSTSDILCIDGNPMHEASVKAKGYSFIAACLSDEKKTIKYYSCPGDGLSTGRSYYLENTEHFNENSYDLIETITLDEVLNGRVFDLIKMDIQGCEYDALCGGRNTISKAKCVILETSVGNYEYNRGSPQQDIVIQKMREYGFVPICSVEEHLYHGKLSHQDILFVLPEHALKFSEVSLLSLDKAT